MNREEFNFLLNSETDNLRNEIQRPGWTTWALTGAVATLIWILIALVEEGDYSLKAVASILTVIWFLELPYLLVKGVISPNPPSTTTGGRFMPSYRAAANRPGIILYCKSSA